MKKNKTYKNGFTLFETLVSVITFGIIMILMFDMSSHFFKLFTTSEARQSMNSKFIKIYNQIQKNLLITDLMYVYTYKTDFTFMKSRWLFFPVPTDKNSIVKGEGNTFNWQRLYIYYLICTNTNCPECPSKSNTQKDTYKYCSDKQLIQLIYDYVGKNDNYFFSTATSKIADHISDYTLPYNSIFPVNIEFNIEGENSDIAKFVEKKIIATDILDMDIKDTLTNITITISAVRKEEIKKELNYGQADFTKEPASKFVDKMEFTVTPKNE